MKCEEQLSPKEEERGGDDRKDEREGREGGGSEFVEHCEGTAKLEQQPGKNTTTTTATTATQGTECVTRHEETQLNTAAFEERSAQEREGREETTTTQETGKKEGNSEECKEEEITEREKGVETSLKKNQLHHTYWGVTRGGELPPSVSVCFEDSPSLLARVQGRLLSLLGRANRYCLPQSLPAPPGMPLEVLRRKVKEARHKLFHHSRPSASKCSQKDKSSASESSSVSESSAPVVSTRGSGRSFKEVEEPLQKYWGGEEGGGAAGVEEEIELLQQYLNLQHLARSRKHSAQLRRIRDSLLLQVRSRPNSVVIPQEFAPVRPAHPAEVPRSDRQQLRDFLLDIGFVQDYSTLNRHGYDLATAAHMDALDLAGAGVTEPLHRMALKHELNLVQRPTQVPEEVPETVEQWLEGLGLTDYVDNFHLNGIYCPLAALNLTKRDLQLMGVYMQGHRKKILLSLTALKETLFRRQ